MLNRLSMEPRRSPGHCQGDRWRTEKGRPPWDPLHPQACPWTSKTLVAPCGPCPGRENTGGGSDSPFQFCFLKKALGSQVGFRDDAGREELENGRPKCDVQPAWPGREVARPEWRRQLRLCLYPGSGRAMEGVRQGRQIEHEQAQEHWRTD